MSREHRATVIAQKDDRLLTIVSRPTPEPGPHDILVQVKAVALNPVDFYTRDKGFPPPPSFPAVIGADAAGVVVKSGSAVTDAPAPGTRVIALMTSFYHEGDSNYSAFQEYGLAPASAVIPLPETMSFEEGASMPLAVLTAVSSWTTVGIPFGTRFDGQKQGVLIWGGSSSVGTFVVQSARLMGYAGIYVTASTRHHAYMRELGATAVFDYKDADVVAQIVKKVKEDGVTLTTAQAVVPDSLQPVLDVLKETKGNAAARVAHSPLLPPDAPTLEGTEVKFVARPEDKKERDDDLREYFHVWLQNGLKSGKVVPSPKVQTVPGGLEGLNAALDILAAGVSGVKVVVPL